MRVARWIVVAIAAIAGPGPQTGAVQVSWSLAAPNCSGTVNEIEIQCGDYGVFQVGGGAPESTTSGCMPSVVSADDPLYYPPPYPGLDPFPDPATHLRDVGPLLESGSVRRRSPPRPRNLIGKAPGPTPPPTPPPSPPAWLAVIDFAGAHGDSTTALAGWIAGESVATLAADLDDPALNALGQDVGDFHVLARLCELAEKIDDGGFSAPVAVNMSFGRAAADNDPDSASSCDTARVSCQIAKVIAHLRTRHVQFVAAAGNHREMLFPASLPDVLAAGMLDVGRFLEDGTTQAAWETPPEEPGVEVDGLAPGNALCLSFWAIPAGSSYSSALLTGLLTDYLRTHPNAAITGGDRWVPREDTSQNCYRLARGATFMGPCNSALRDVFVGLSGGYAANCWGQSTTPSENLPPPAPAEGQPILPSFDQFAVSEHPAPEADPCVPCVGKGVARGGGGGEESLLVDEPVDLSVDMSQSQALPNGIQIDSMSLRVGTNFYPLFPTASQLDWIESAILLELILYDVYPLLDPAEQPSLWYRLRPANVSNCNNPQYCYWSSTPILMQE